MLLFVVLYVIDVRLMGKVIKILFHIISGVVLTLIILPLVLAILLYLPPVQSMLVGKINKIASNAIESKVDVGKIRIKLFNHVSIDGFYVEDGQQDTMIYVGKLDVGLNMWQLLKGDLSFGKVTLKDTKFYLNQEADGTTGFKKALAKLTNPDKKVIINLKFGEVKIDNLTFLHRKLSATPTEGRVNFNDVEVTNMSLNAKKATILGDNISMQIKQLALREKSGFVLDDLSCRWIEIKGGDILLTDAKIQTPDSDINMEYARLLADSWRDYSEFTRKVIIESKLFDTRASMSTLGYFMAQKRKMSSTLENVSLNVAGVVDNLSGSIANANFGVGTNLALEFAVRNITTIKKANFKLNIGHLRSNLADINSILKDVAPGEGLGDIERVIDSFGVVEVNGHLNGTLSKLAADVKINTSHGGAALDLKFNPGERGLTAFVGNVSVKQLNIGKLLNNKNLGVLTIQGGVDGNMGSGELDLNTDIVIKELDFNQYRYSDVLINGRFDNRLFKGNIASNDPNIDFDFDGTLDFNDSVPRYDFDMKLHNADLQRLHFNTRDSVSILKCRVIASASGTNVDNLNGIIRINELRYRNQVDSIRTGEIRLIGENDSQGKYLAFRSLFADAEYRSRSSYSQMLKDLQKVLYSYAPTLVPAEEHISKGSQMVGDAEGYSLLKIDVKKANNLAGILAPGLIVAQGSKLSLMFNPTIGQLSLAASSDYIEYGDNFISELDINTRNQGDSISLFLRAQEIYGAGFYIPNFSVMGSVRDNKMNIAMRFADTTRHLSALMGAAATFRRDAVLGIPQMRVTLTPSSITSGDQTWNIFTRGIVIDSTKIEINRFTIASTGQSLQVNGVASKNIADTLHIQLTNFDLEPFSRLTNRAGYHIEGRTSGHADMLAAQGSRVLYAGISFDSLRVNNVDVPPLQFQSLWSKERERAVFMLTVPSAADTLMRGYYNPKDGKYLANVKMRGVDVSLLNPLMKGVISRTVGAADVDLKVSGERRDLKLNGVVNVPKLTTTVDFLNVSYTIDNARVDVVDNIMKIQPTKLFDQMGNSADIDMRVNLSSLKNIVYNINVVPHELLVLNTTGQNSELFYGRMFASGRASIKGDKRGVNMDITATTAGRSEFYLPLNGSTGMGKTDIITFIDPKKEDIDSTDYVVRKQLIIERKNKVKSQVEASNMNIKLAMTVLPNTELQILIDPRVGDILKGRGNGSLTLNINPTNDEFSMYGDYEITEGSYQFTLQDIISRRFTIERGSKITWTGEPTNAMLNVSAEYNLKASLAPLLGSSNVSMTGKIPVKCHIMLGDRLSHPDITFRVEVPDTSPETQALVANALGTQESMATQFFFLLAANTFYSDSGAGGIGGLSGSATAFEFLSSQISNWISTDKFDIGIRYTPKDTEKMSSDEVNIDLSTQLFNNRVLLEVEGNYDTGNNPGLNRNTNNLTGDFSVTWLIDHSGSLRAKGFTRTINRYDENQGLQEGGLGLYYKEDFNTVKDIIQNFKDRFSSAKRKQRRAERKAAKEIEARRKAIERGEVVEIKESEQNDSDDDTK